MTTTPTKNESLPELFRKKPVVIEARQLVRHEGESIAHWCGGQWLSLYGRGDKGEDISHVLIPTLEGTMRADLGDWIIKGVRGEFYPCKPDIFTATYEAALTREAPTEGGWVLIPRDRIAALPILHALADAAGMERLPDPGNADDAYPITGDQSTVWQWYKAMLDAATPPAPQRLAQGDDEFSLSAEELAVWLDRKYARHGEDEDRQAAAMLRKLSTQPPHHDQGEVIEHLQKLEWMRQQIGDSKEIAACYEVACIAFVRAHGPTITAALTEAKQQGIIDGEFDDNTGKLSNWQPWRVFRDDDGALWLTTDDPEHDIEVDDDRTAGAKQQGPGEAVGEVVFDQEIRWKVLWKDLPVGTKLYTAPQVEAKRQTGDDLLRAIADNYWKVDPFDMPTPGGDDADVGWRISEYHGRGHDERVVIEHFRDDLPGAIREAIAAAAKPSGESEQ
jgi:hypothetical protein